MILWGEIRYTSTSKLLVGLELIHFAINDRASRCLINSVKKISLFVHCPKLSSIRHHLGRNTLNPKPFTPLRKKFSRHHPSIINIVNSRACGCLVDTFSPGYRLCRYHLWGSLDIKDVLCLRMPALAIVHCRFVACSSHGSHGCCDGAACWSSGDSGREFGNEVNWIPQQKLCCGSEFCMMDFYHNLKVFAATIQRNGWQFDLIVWSRNGGIWRRRSENSHFLILMDTQFLYEL